MGGCFSVFQGVEALRSSGEESTSGYVVGLVVLGVAVLAVVLVLVVVLTRRGRAPEAAHTLMQEGTR